MRRDLSPFLACELQLPSSFPSLLLNMARRSSLRTTKEDEIISKLLDFLDSSIWLLPIETFIEQNSCMFDRQQENAHLYDRMHKEFSSLVDTLLECFCDDCNIQPQHLVQALKNLNKDRLSARKRAATEPLAAAQNLNVFIPMMMRKNVELQLEALQMIEFMCGLMPSVLQLEEEYSLKNKSKEELTGEEVEKYVLLSVLRQSREEFEREQAMDREMVEQIMRMSIDDRRQLQKAHALEQKEMDDALEKAHEKNSAVPPRKKSESSASRQGTSASGERRPSTAKRTPSRDARRNSTANKEMEKSKDDEKEKVKAGNREEKKSEKTMPPAESVKKDSPVTRNESLIEESEGNSAQTKRDLRALLQSAAGGRVPSADVKARAEYLRAQRDRLLLMKRAQREQQLKANSDASSRPKTANAARGAMRGQIGKNSDVEVLEARRAIYDKLKMDS